MNYSDWRGAVPSLPTPTGGATLFEHYRPNTCLFASPSQTLLAHGEVARLPFAGSADLPARAALFLHQAVQAGHAGLLVGAIGFVAEQAPHLYLPEHIELAGGGRAALAVKGGAPARSASTRSIPSAEGYRANVRAALKRIATHELEKVVLARRLEVQGEVELPALLHRLAVRNPLGYTYAIPLPTQQGRARTLVGASPELLLSRRGDRVLSNPLAGSVPRSADAHEDARRAQALLRSPKDLHEHALVIDAVAAALRPYCSDLQLPPGPSLLQTPTLWHLSTEIVGRLREPTTSALELALALHPTPAVCGHPRHDAHAFIRQVEGFDRGYFTGLVGWCNHQGDGEWAVAIRCAEVAAAQATLYAGAGIVAGSDPELELRETAAKLATMLEAMGLAREQEQCA